MAMWAAGIGPDLLPKLAAAGIHSLEDFCTRSDLDLVETLDLSRDAVHQLRARVADANTPPLETVRGSATGPALRHGAAGRCDRGASRAPPGIGPDSEHGAS